MSDNTYIQSCMHNLILCSLGYYFNKEKYNWLTYDFSLMLLLLHHSLLQVYENLPKKFFFDLQKWMEMVVNVNFLHIPCVSSSLMPLYSLIAAQTDQIYWINGIFLQILHFCRLNNFLPTNLFIFHRIILTFRCVRWRHPKFQYSYIMHANNIIK
jgi:hypothetical protein